MNGPHIHHYLHSWSAIVNSLQSLSHTTMRRRMDSRWWNPSIVANGTLVFSLRLLIIFWPALIQVLLGLLKEWREDRTNKVLIFTKSVKLIDMMSHQLKKEGMCLVTLFARLQRWHILGYGYLQLDGNTKKQDRECLWCFLCCLLKSSYNDRYADDRPISSGSRYFHLSHLYDGWRYRIESNRHVFPFRSNIGLILS